MPQIFDNGFSKLYQSNAFELPIPDNSVDCVVTSPPYWGLRDYGIGEWVGGDEGCDHIGPPHRTRTGFNERWHGKQFQEDKQGSLDEPYKDICGKCGAKRIDKQIGLEPTPEEYCTNMVKVFREVWRVLKSTGTVWLNLGDSYSSGSRTTTTNDRFRGDTMVNTVRTPVSKDLKQKDLVGIPWRVAFALQADGWYLRSDIIWSKPNPMPESVTDRPTKAHEYVFLLTKSPRYYYDADAIREPQITEASGKMGSGLIGTHNGMSHGGWNPVGERVWNPLGRNKRSVWEIPTQPYSEAHFATYPQKLVEPCILSGTSEKGVCAECGKPWERIVHVSGGTIGQAWHNHEADIVRGMRDNSNGKSTDGTYKREHKGWQPTCTCNADTVPATVLDPFVGSGTTLLVAHRLGRKSIGVDLNDEYLEMAQKRLESMPIPMLLTT